MINCKNILYFASGRGAIAGLSALINARRKAPDDYCILFVDQFFKDSTLFSRIELANRDRVIFVPTEDEPKTSSINLLYRQLSENMQQLPCVIVGIGGGITLDTAKAISNLMTNGGQSEDYQGWDLVKKPGIYKIGVPTISGTGAESSRTCVLTNFESGLKLGMNSDYTMYDQLVLDYELTASVPRDQYFYTGMDSYIHCLESLNGRFRNAVGDSFSDQALKLSREIFLSDDMKSDICREKLMIASYLGGCAIAHSFVGVIHPFSAGLSVVLGIHHGIANCMVMTAMQEFYPKEVDEFWNMAEKQSVNIPRGVCKQLTDEQFVQLYHATIIHEKPLSNALGDNFREILTLEKAINIFQRM